MSSEGEGEGGNDTGDTRGSSGDGETRVSATGESGGDSPDENGDGQETPHATREDPTRSRPPAEWGGGREEWSSLSDEARRIEFFASLSVEDRDPGILVPEEGRSRGSNPGGDAGESVDGVPAETCAEIRQTMHDALTAKEVVDEYPHLHTSKIMRHAYGECSHDIETPATASPQIGPDECQAMREDYREGDSITEIASRWSRAENTVTRHVFGRCSHDSVPMFEDSLTVEKCGRLREAYRSTRDITVGEVACAMRVSPPTARDHLVGECSHSEGRPPTDPVDL